MGALFRALTRVVQTSQLELQFTEVDQTSSPLGPRRHIALVRSGKLPGTQVGRQYLARSSDVQAYIVNHPTAVVGDPEERQDEVDKLATELGLQRNDEGGNNAEGKESSCGCGCREIRDLGDSHSLW